MNSSSQLMKLKSYLFRYYVLLIWQRDYVIGKIEKLRGIDFTEPLELKSLNLSADNSYGYQTTTYKRMKTIFSAFNITKNDTIIDLGCGKGKALYEMSKFYFNKIDGVEISSKLCDIAENNLKKLHVNNVEIYNIDATLFTDLKKYNYIYFFNPFPAPIFRKVMNNIENSLNKSPRKITIIYNFPKCHEEVIRSGVFNEIKKGKLLRIYTNQ